MNTNADIRMMTEQRAAMADARSHAYSLFAQAFRYPESAVLEAIVDGSYGEALCGALSVAFPQFVGDFEQDYLPRITVAASMAEFEASYLAAFENNLPRPSLSLYEGSYGERRGNKPGLLLELKAFYRNFGLSMADNEMEDALVAELEFMQFLAAKQALAEQGVLDRVPYLRAQRDFLEHHLAAWLPELKATAGATLEYPFWLAMVELIAAFVALDRASIAADQEFAGT